MDYLAVDPMVVGSMAEAVGSMALLGVLAELGFDPKDGWERLPKVIDPMDDLGIPMDCLVFVVVVASAGVVVSGFCCCCCCYCCYMDMAERMACMATRCL